MEEGLDFKYIIILIFLNERKYTYNTYDIVKLLSLDYDVLRGFIEKLLQMNLIEKDEKIKRYSLTVEGTKVLKRRNLLNFNLEDLIERNFEKYEVDSPIIKYTGNILYIPKEFEL